MFDSQESFRNRFLENWSQTFNTVEAPSLKNLDAPLKSDENEQQFRLECPVPFQNFRHESFFIKRKKLWNGHFRLKFVLPEEIKIFRNTCFQVYFSEKNFPYPFFGQVSNNDVDIFDKYLKIISDYRLFYSRDPQPPMTLC